MHLVIANYRTGSTTLCWELTDSLGLAAPESGKLFEVFLHKYTSTLPSFDVVKIMPNQLGKHRDKFFAEWFPHVSSIHYSLRTDWYQQLLSYVIAKKINQWHPKSINPHCAFSEKSGSITVSPGDLVKNERLLYNNLVAQAELFEQYPGTVHWLEHRSQCKYSRNNIKIKLDCDEGDLQYLLAAEELFEKIKNPK